MSQSRSLLPMTASPIRDLKRPSPTRRQGGEALPPALCALTPGSQPHHPPTPTTSTSRRFLTSDSWGRREPGRGRPGTPRQNPSAGEDVWASGLCRQRPGGPQAQPLRPDGSGAYDAAAKAAAAAGGGGGRGKEGRRGEGQTGSGGGWWEGRTGEEEPEGGWGRRGQHLTPLPSPPTGLEGAGPAAACLRLGGQTVGPGWKGNP